MLTSCDLASKLSQTECHCHTPPGCRQSAAAPLQPARQLHRKPRFQAMVENAPPAGHRYRSCARRRLSPADPESGPVHTAPANRQCTTAAVVGACWQCRQIRGRPIGRLGGNTRRGCHLAGEQKASPRVAKSQWPCPPTWSWSWPFTTNCSGYRAPVFPTGHSPPPGAAAMQH